MPESLKDASAERVLKQIGPGKRIRSDVLKWVVERVRDLGDQIETGKRVQVPTFIGRTLEDARTILGEDTIRLRLGPVLDIEGKSVDPEEASNTGRIVLMQTPGPDERTIANRQVRLLVAAADDESTPAPVIESFSAETVRVREEVIVRGKNFPSPWDSSRGDSITFNGVEGTVQLNESHSQALVVRIPEGIPGVPDSGEATTDVTVEITTSGGKARDTLQVQPPSGQEIPEIDEIVSADDGNIRVGGKVEIRGSGFSGTPPENTVLYGSVEREATDRTSQGITAPVPSAGELGISGDGREISVNVRVAGVETEESEPVFVFIPDDNQ